MCIACAKICIPWGVEEWIRKPMKSTNNVSIMWKVVLLSIGIWFVWKVGDESKVKLGVDTWVGCTNIYKFPKHIITFLRVRVFHKLIHIANLELTALWKQEWRSVGWIGFRRKYVEVWEAFIGSIIVI